jgi:RNA polymerase sigma-70 factor (ECF subfamily)
MDESALLAAAVAGDRAAFARLVQPSLRSLRAFIYRMVAHPEDADDLAQETLLRAYQKLDSFRGESSLRTWLFAIATRACLDHLRSRRPWPAEGQLEAERFAKSTEEELAPIHAALAAPEFRFDVREHVAFCFACVGRSLAPEEQAALLLREVFDFSNGEAARMVGVTESVFRHRLAAARGLMEEIFDGLCALVSKRGACYQCDVLREATPEAQRGKPVRPLGPLEDPPTVQLDRRLRIVRDAQLEEGTSRGLHETVFRLMSRMYSGPA